MSHCPTCNAPAVAPNVYRCQRCGLSSVYCKCTEPIPTWRYEPAKSRDPMSEPLREIVLRYGASMHKAGQESVRQSGYAPRAQQLADDALAAVEAALAAGGGAPAGPWRAAVDIDMAVQARLEGWGWEPWFVYAHGRRSLHVRSEQEALGVRDALNRVASRSAGSEEPQ